MGAGAATMRQGPGCRSRRCSIGPANENRGLVAAISLRDPGGADQAFFFAFAALGRDAFTAASLLLKMYQK